MRADLRGFLARTGGWLGVTCVAPHPDDESAGCGGLLAGCARLGVPVRVVVTTDGAASHRSEAWPAERLAALRRDELRAALRALGVVAEPVFLGLRDAATPGGPPEARAAARLAAVLRADRPGLVLTTWRGEPHCDHRHAAEIAARAARGLPVRVAAYFVWTPLTGKPLDDAKPGDGLTLDLELNGIDRAAKRAALACHRSQLGLVVTDDPDGFVLGEAEAARMTGPTERYLVT